MNILKTQNKLLLPDVKAYIKLHINSDEKAQYESGAALDLLVDLTGYMRHFGMTGLSCQTYAASPMGW